MAALTCGFRRKASRTSSTSTPTAIFTPMRGSPNRHAPLVSTTSSSPSDWWRSRSSDTMEIRPIAARDRESLSALLRRIETFSAEEVQVALEVIDASLNGSQDYQVLTADRDGELIGYVCYGPT